jgi:predicted kinase
MDGTVMLESWWFRPRNREVTEVAWRRCGMPELVEVWCDVPADTARTRAASRARHPMQGGSDQLVNAWEDWARRAAPLGLGAVIRVDTSVEVDVASIVHELSKPPKRPLT